MIATSRVLMTVMMMVMMMMMMNQQLYSDINGSHKHIHQTHCVCIIAAL